MEFTKPATVLVGSRPILTTLNADMEIDSGDQEIKTLALGLIGYSDGATTVKFSGNFPVPKTGLEYDFPTICASHTTIDIGFKFGDVTYQLRGRVLNCKMTSDPSKPADLSISFGGFILAYA